VNQTDAIYFIHFNYELQIGKCAVLAITVHIWAISVQPTSAFTAYHVKKMLR